MNLDTSRYRLFHEFETLRQRWHDLKSRWQDVVRQEFDDAFWKPLEESVKTALDAMDRITPVVSQVQQDCSGREYL